MLSNSAIQYSPHESRPVDYTNTSPEAVIATHDIGIIGYYTQRQIVDLAGLITPEIVPIMNNPQKMADFVRAKQVTYLIVYSGYYRELLMYESRRAACAQTRARGTGIPTAQRPAGVVPASGRPPRDRPNRPGAGCGAGGAGLEARQPPRESRGRGGALCGPVGGIRAPARHRPEVRETAARVLLRARSARGLVLGPSYPVRLALGRARRRREESRVQGGAATWLEGLEEPSAPIRVTVVSPEPTPYRSPLFDLVAARPELELTVIYAAHTVAGRTWSVEPQHRSTFLRGLALPGLGRVLHHDYPVTPGIVRALRESRPDVVVVSGWSTFASQAAIVWCRRRGVPYLPLVESHDLGPRKGWRRAVKGAVVPPVLRRSAGALALGTASRDSLVERGVQRERVHIFANTIDVPRWEERQSELAQRRPELRAELGAAVDDVLLLSVARLGPEKGLDILVRGVAAAGDPKLLLVIAGEGPQRREIEALAQELGVRLRLTGTSPPTGSPRPMRPQTCSCCSRPGRPGVWW